MSFGAGSAIPVGLVIPTGPRAPVLANTVLSLDVTRAPTTGAPVGAVTNTGGVPTSATITAGNAANNYAITTAGVIIIGLNGNANLRTTGTDVLTVIASNSAGGSGPVTVTINRLQAPILGQVNNFQATVGAPVGSAVGTVATTGGVPTTETLTGTGSGNYAITLGGVITTAVSPTTIGTDNLTATAANASGISTAPVTINRVQSNVAPNITDITFNLSLIPPTNNVVGTIQSSTGTNISYTITSENGGAPTGRYNLAISTGILTVTAAGHGALTAEGTDILVVTATNSVGSDSATVSIQKWLDGFVNAPIGTAPNGKVTAQYPTFLNGLCRPPWRVAGVDYGVGYPAGQVFKIPGTGAGTTALPAGCQFGQIDFNAGTVIPAPDATHHCVLISGNNVVFDGWDLTVGGGWTVYVTGNGCTVQNCNFKVGTNLQDPIAFDVSGSGTLQNCIIDGNSLLTTSGPKGPGGPTCVDNTGSVSMFYNWIKNGIWDLIDLHGTGSNSYLIRFNLLDNGARSTDPNAHSDWVQTYTEGGDPGYNTITVEYNTNRQTPPVGGGAGTQGWTLNMNSHPPTVGVGVQNINFNNNTSVDTSASMNYYMAYDLTNTVGVVSINKNYAVVPENTGTVAFRQTAGGGPDNGVVTGVGNTKINGAVCSQPANWNFGAINPPILAVQSFNLPLSPAPTAGQLVGTLNFTGGTPTSWSLTVTPASAQAFFEIITNANGTGALRVASTYTTGITAQTYQMLVQATNAGGPSNAVTDPVVAALAAPVMSAQTVNLQLPVTARTTPDTGTLVLQGSATNGPTAASWALSNFNPLAAVNWFGVETTAGTPGRVYVTSAGVTALDNTTQNVTFTMTASNATGLGSALQTVHVLAAQAPTIVAQNFPLTLPTTANTPIGTLNFSNGVPTSWTAVVTPASAQNFFAITTNANGTGALKIASTYPGTGLTAQTYQLAIHATNGVGDSNTVTDNVTATGALPVLTPQTMPLQLPVMQLTAVGQPIAATNNPTPSSWQLSSFNPPTAGTWFQVDTAGATPGQVRVTSAGANALNSANINQSITFTATASNANGPGSAQMTVNVVANTGFNDGITNAPFGTPQFPLLFTSTTGGPQGGLANGQPHAVYTAGPGIAGVRNVGPGWHVPGVDYYVGVPQNLSLKPGAQAANLPGAIFFAPPEQIGFNNTGADIIIDGYDFSDMEILLCYTNQIHGNIIVRNCRFNARNGDPIRWFSSESDGNVLIENCSFDGLGVLHGGGAQNNLINVSVSGGHSVTIRYCHLKNGGGDCIENGGGTPANTVHYTIQYCLFENPASIGDPQAHGDWSAGNMFCNDYLIQGCCMIGNSSGQFPQGFGWGCGGADNQNVFNTKVQGTFDHNAVVGPCSELSAVLNVGTTGQITVAVTNNYWDPNMNLLSAKAGFQQPQCVGGTYTCTGNINLVTGAPLNPPHP